MKIIVIGSSVFETTCQIDGNIKEGERIILDNRIECGGGVAGNIAYVLGKWGAETYIASMLGADDFANKIKKEFESVGVRTDYIETSYDKSTGQSIVLVNKTTKQVTLFDILSNAYLKKYSFAVEPDVIVTDGNDFNATIAALDRYGKALSFLVLKRLTKESIELCKYVKYIIFNQNTAEIVSNSKIDFGNSSTIVNTYNKLKQKFDKAEIVITLGDKGSVYSINSNVKIMPPLKMEVVDPNGAGEVYAGALIYGMANNFGIERSVAYATIAASMCVNRPSSRNSVPSINEVSNYYDGKFGSQNNPNKTLANNFKNESPNMSTTEVSETSVQNVANTTINPTQTPTPNTPNTPNNAGVMAPNMNTTEPTSTNAPNNGANNNFQNPGVN